MTYLFDLTCFACSLNVLEMDFWFLTEIHNGAQKVKESLEALELLEKFNQGYGCQLLMILGGDLYHHLQVLPDVGCQHGLQALHGVLNAEGAKEVDQPFGFQQMRMNDGPLDVIKVRVVFQGSLQKAGFFAQLSNVSTVVMGEHLVAHDGVGHLGCGHKVHFQEAGLQRSFAWSVILKKINLLIFFQRTLHT